MALRAVIAGLALLVLVYFMPHLRQLDGMANYLPLHIGLETLSVVMSSLPFVLIWSLRRQAIARNYAVLACGLLAVALLDFIHMLSYKGMPDFFGPSSPEKAIYFWLAARAVDATNLLLVAYLGWDKVASRRLFRLLLMGAFALVAAISLVYFNFEPHLPRTFKASTGLTPLKIGFEYVLILLYGLAALGFYLGLRQPPKVSRSWLFAAACVMAQGEFLFTIYTDVNDIYNITGHFYKLFAYAFVFRAAFIENVRLPYKQLQSSRDHMQATLEALPDLVFEMDIQGNFLDMYVSQRNSHLLLAPEGVMIGKNASEIMAAESAQKVLEALQQASQHGLAHGAIIHVALSKQEFSFELSVAAKPRVANESERFVVLARDIGDCQASCRIY